MSYRQVGEAYIDQCYRCGGSFLDFGKVGYALGEQADPRNWPKEALACDPWPSQLMCPAGHGRMWSHLLKADEKKVEIDSCAACHSLWFDQNESQSLAEIVAEAKVMNARPGAGVGKVGIVAVYLL